MMKPCEESKKPNFDPNFGPPTFFLWVLTLVVVRHYSTFSSYAVYMKTNEPNLRKW